MSRTAQPQRRRTHLGRRRRPTFTKAVRGVQASRRCFIRRSSRDGPGLAAAGRVPRRIASAGVAARTLADTAAVFKARFKISLADAFAAALAKEKKAELVTGDPEFKALEKEIKITWLK